jgi:hypothetical protein
MTYSGSVVLEKKIFKWPNPIFAFLRLSPLWRGPGPLIEQFRFPFTQGWCMLSLIEIGLLVLEKKIFPYINICKYSFPYCGPSRPPGTMMWTILNLNYIRELSSKYDLFWLKIFKWPNPIFTFLRLSPRWRGPGPLFEQFRIPSPQGWFIPSLIEIGLLVLEKIF